MGSCTFEFRVKLKQLPKKKLSGRSKFGCLCCRKRKVKCNELKPVCLSCQKRGFVCVWPENGEQSLSRCNSFRPTRVVGHELSDVKRMQKGFRKFKFDVKGCSTITSTSSGIMNSSEVPASSSPHNLETSSSQELILVGTSSIVAKPKSPQSPIEEITTTSEITNIEYSNSDGDLWYRDYIRRLSLSSGPSHILTGHRTWLIGIDMTQEESYCYDAYLKGFMVATSPQHSHINLQPATVVVPYVSESSPVRSIMYACGALFLSLSDENMVPVALRNLEQCLSLILTMLNIGLMDGSEEFLMVVSMMLIVKEKYFETSTATHLVQLKMLYYLIKQWWFNRNGTSEDKNTGFDYSLSSELTAILEDKVRNNPKYSSLSEKVLRLYNRLNKSPTPIVHSISMSDDPITMKYIDFSSDFNTLSDLDSSKRLMVDSFLFNYSVSWLTCDSSNLYLLESPFQVFEELKPMLLGNIYNCPAYWMNYPVTGAGLPAIELLAKTSWLALQVPLDDHNKHIAQKLLQFAKFYVSPVLPIDVLSYSKLVQNKLKESCYLGELTAIASTIFLTKILHPDVTAYDERIQEYVKGYISGLKKLTPYCAGSVNGVWAFVVAGSAMVESKDRDYLFERLDNFNKTLQMECVINIKDYLRTVWGYEDFPSLGLDGLFNRELLQTLSI